MFRDLKEYQEIAKIYADKVSKPENLDENRNTRGKELAAQRLANKPKTREEVGLPPKKKISPFERKFGKERNEKRLVQSGLKKPIPTTDQIRKNNPNVVPGTRVNEIGQKSDKPSEGDFKKDFPDKPKISTMTSQGKPRTKAQMMAAKRIGSGTAKNPDTTIAQVKQKNQDDMRARAKAKFEAFKKRRAEKKTTPTSKETSSTTQAKPNVSAGTPNRKETSSTTQSGNTTTTKTKVTSGTGGGTEGLTSSAGSLEANKKKAERLKAIAAKNAAMEKEFESKQFDAYDLVLEYLLYTEQAATIEEANYVMTEMDAETIQGIVEEQKKNLDEGIGKALMIGGALATPFLMKKFVKPKTDKMIEKGRKTSPIGGENRKKKIEKAAGAEGFFD